MINHGGDIGMIPVFCPQLPRADAINYYLNEIDKTRWYSNFGPLLNEFEKRLASHFGVNEHQITSAANGTLMLVTLLKALNVPKNALCLMPSWTFIATASAACYAGLTPYFVDVDRTTQALDPLQLKKQITDVSSPIGAVIVVSPFGTPIDSHAWDQFTIETNIPVIIDAAAGFDTVGRLSMPVQQTPIMVSLHATKVCGIGEGGIALSTNIELIKKTKAMTVFGFNAEREAYMLGSNVKLSEYAAAVGLAALDQWQENRGLWQQVRDEYSNQLMQAEIAHHLSAEWVSSTCNILLPNNADVVAEKIRKEGIDTRKWWLNGCHRHRAYQHFPKHNELHHTEWLSQSVLGIPFAMDMQFDKITFVCHQLKNVIHQLKKIKVA